MATKSKVFRGAFATDLRPGFRADVYQLAMLPDASLNTLANLLVEDAKTLLPTKISMLAVSVARELHVSTEQSRVLARGGRYLASQIALADDKAADVADDLVSLQIIPQEKRPSLQRFLELIQTGRSNFVGRSTRQEADTGGGYHLASVSGFAELRAVFTSHESENVDPEHYVPEFMGFMPSVTLQLELHKGEEGPKSISIRLSESDLTDLEKALKIARVELEAAKKRSGGAQQ